MLVFYGKELGVVSPLLNTNLEDHHLMSFHDCLFNIFALFHYTIPEVNFKDMRETRTYSKCMTRRSKNISISNIT
jgi:hypothetical protein